MEYYSIVWLSKKKGSCVEPFGEVFNDLYETPFGYGKSELFDFDLVKVTLLYSLYILL